MAGLVQDCSISIANALETMQSCNKPLIWGVTLGITVLADPIIPNGDGAEAESVLTTMKKVFKKNA